MTRTISTDRLHRVTVLDFQDARDAFNCDVPDDPGDFTPDTITTLLSHLSVCEGYLLTMQRLAEHRATCQPCPTYTDETRQAAREALDQREALRGMVNDIGPSSYEVDAWGAMLP